MMLKPNLDRHGRLLRATIGCVLLLASRAVLEISTPRQSLLVAGWVVLYVPGILLLVEAGLGWCALRACRPPSCPLPPSSKSSISPSDSTA